VLSDLPWTPFRLATGVVGFVGFPLQLAAALGSCGRIEGTAGRPSEPYGINGPSLYCAESIGVKHHGTRIQNLAARTSRVRLAWFTSICGMFLTLPRGDSYATVAGLCIALDETSIFVQRLTDQTKREDFKLDSLSLPDDTRSLAILWVVLRQFL